MADPGMGGPGGRPPAIDQNLGLVMAAPLRHRGKFSLKSLTFSHFLYKNVQKAFSFRVLRPLTPHQGLHLGADRLVPPPALGKSWIRHWSSAQCYRASGPASAST